MSCRLSRAPNPNCTRFSFDGLVEPFVPGQALAPLRCGYGVSKLLKGVEYRDAGRFEVAEVAGYDGQAVFEGRCGD